ncbi:Uncharacterised protein [Mycobacterium tuberculosis]|nr:Uncharacterised protein [Mycobacterium tuberculosis]
MRHRNAGVEWPTPLGSKPTRSKWRRMSVSAIAGAIAATMSTADAPGPPGLTSSAPNRCPVAGTRITANFACVPPGWS